MASHYAQYMKEREGIETLENEKGFLSYHVFTGNGFPQFVIYSVYIEPQYRKTNTMVKLCEEVRVIASDAGFKEVYASVVPTLPLSTYTILILLKYGFDLYRSNENFIMLKKLI